MHCARNVYTVCALYPGQTKSRSQTPPSAREKGSGEFGPYRFLGLAGSVRARRNCCTETNLGSDWSVMLPDDSNLYSRQWRFAFLRLVSHMTALKLQSHWSAQIPFPGPRIVSKFTRPFFPRRGWGLGTRLGQTSRLDVAPVPSIVPSLWPSAGAPRPVPKLRSCEATRHSLETRPLPPQRLVLSG